MKNWSEYVWSLVEPIYQKILQLPFIIELAKGTLSRDRFLFYIEQDSIYIANYARVLAHIASRLKRSDHIDAFLKYALGGINMEKTLHRSYIGAEISNVAIPSPVTLLYNSFETSKGLGPVEVEVASILPCFWVYQKVGTHIVSNSLLSDLNPYKAWILAYSDPYMEESTRGAIKICDELAEKASDEVCEAMTEAFVMSTRMEWMFWDSVYNKNKWEI